MKYSVLALLLALAIGPIYAQERHPSIVLESIAPIHTTEKSGDEVYINITEYLPNGKTKSTNIPMPPIAWSSKNLTEIKDLTLWQGKLAKGESANVIMTFIEQDNPPLDPDDLLGVVQLNIINTQQGLKTSWSVRQGTIKTSAQRTSKDKQQYFMLTGSQGSYSVAIKLSE